MEFEKINCIKLNKATLSSDEMWEALRNSCHFDEEGELSDDFVVTKKFLQNIAEDCHCSESELLLEFIDFMDEQNVEVVIVINKISCDEFGYNSLKGI